MINLTSTSLQMAAQTDLSSVTATTNILACGQYYYPESFRPALSLDSFHRISTQLQNIGSLSFGWNGYGALPITTDVKNNALSFLILFCASPLELPDPLVSPIHNGTIGFAWENDQGEAYLELGATTYSAFILSKSGKQVLFEGSAKEIDRDFLPAVHETLFKSLSPTAGFSGIWLPSDSGWPSTVFSVTEY